MELSGINHPNSTRSYAVKRRVASNDHFYGPDINRGLLGERK
jgi:hypothetical protein